LTHLYKIKDNSIFHNNKYEKVLSKEEKTNICMW